MNGGQEDQQGGQLWVEAELAIRAAAYRPLDEQEIAVLRYAAGLINRQKELI
jgi:hypothetical protein